MQPPHQLTPLNVARLQRRIGNQQVLALLDSRTPAQMRSQEPTAPGEAPLQRLIAWAEFSEKLGKTGNSKTGSSQIFDIGVALRAFHTEDAKKDKKTDVLLGHLKTILTLCDKWLTLIPKPPKPVQPADQQKSTLIIDLRKDAATEQVKLDASLAPVVVIPPLPADKGKKIQDRLAWMLAKSRQLNATKPEQEAGPLIEQAQHELRRVLLKQRLQMEADALRKAEKKDEAKVPQGKADKVTLGAGENALSAILGKLFNIFQYVPLAFAGTATQTPVVQMQAFSARAKELLAGLTIKGQSGKVHTGFTDVELVVGGSSTMGYSPHKEGTPEFHDKSDVDLGAISPKLLEACRDWGVDMRGLGDRTEPDPAPIAAVSRQLETLVPFVDKDGKLQNRKLSIMVYASRNAAQRGVSAQI